MSIVKPAIAKPYELGSCPKKLVTLANSRVLTEHFAGKECLSTAV